MHQSSHIHYEACRPCRSREPRPITHSQKAHVVSFRWRRRTNLHARFIPDRGRYYNIIVVDGLVLDRTEPI